MKKKVISVVLTAAMTAALGTVPAMADDVIKVGVFEPLTGENGGGGVQEAQTAKYANELRPTVTIDGKEYTVELDEVDNKSDKTEGVTAAQKLVSDGVVGILGSYGSGVSIAAGPTFQEAKIPAIGISCTNPQVTLGNDYYFRVCFLDPFQGSVMAQYAYEDLGLKNVAILEQLGDDYSSGLAGFFEKQFTALGGTITTTQEFQTNQSDFKAALTEVKASGAEALFAPSSIATAPLVIKQARELGLEIPIMAGDTWYNTTSIDNAGADNCEGVAVSTFFDEADDTPAVADFVKGYKAWLNEDKDRISRNGGNDKIVGNSALMYDGYNVLLDAIEAAGSTDGEAIRDALASSNYDGVTGNITFDENGDANKDTAYIDVIKDGAFVFEKTVTVGGPEASTEG